MSKHTRLLALLLVVIMTVALAACGKPAVTPEGTLVYATSTFDQKFTPFFYTTAYDADIVNLSRKRHQGRDPFVQRNRLHLPRFR